MFIVIVIDDKEKSMIRTNIVKDNTSSFVCSNLAAFYAVIFPTLIFKAPHFTINIFKWGQSTLDKTP